MEKKTKTSRTSPPSGEALKDKIIKAYKEHLLEHGSRPVSVFLFTKKSKMTETDFYAHFNSFNALESEIWTGFFEQTVSILNSDEAYADYSARERLLAFYYTLAEVLKADRSLVVQMLQHCPKNGLFPPFVNEFRTRFSEYASGIIARGLENSEIMKRTFLSERYHEGLWVQLWFVIKFWLRDDSKNFERTDEAIEKAVNLSFDLMGRNPLDSALDFARFLFKQS